MSEDHNLEDELAEILNQSSGDMLASTLKAPQPADLTPPAPKASAPAERPREKQLSQAEIDALLASMNLG